MKHTKGKWKTTYVDTPIEHSDMINVETNDTIICEIIDSKASEKSIEEALANAKLIAASPDLLAACYMAKEELVFGGDWEAAKLVIERAIKQATK